eukprot:m.23277 g.23277  ORF g.23277 m.23277 type:complete len:517 (-) comp14150_c0_seq1:65-1615(-)
MMAVPSFVMFSTLMVVASVVVLYSDHAGAEVVEEDIQLQELEDLKTGARSSVNMGVWEYAVYILGTVSAIPLGYMTLKIPSREGKQWANLIFGLTLGVLAAGFNILHAFVMFGVVFLLVRFAPQSISPHGISFVFSMGYLMFFRLCHLYFPQWPQKSGPNGAMMMIVTYRAISVAFDVRASPLKIGRGEVYEDVIPIPTALEFFSYAFSFNGLIVSPVVTFRDYHNYLKLNPTSLNDAALRTIVSRGKTGIASIVIFALLKMYVPKPPLSDLLQGWTSIETALTLTWQLALGCYQLRFQYHAVWALAEQGVMWSGIGSTADGYNQDEITNIEPVEIELFSWSQEVESRFSITHIVRNWNMSVQRWLVRYVFRRFPIRAVRTSVVFVVSAYMHGISMGFYFFFVQLAIFDLTNKRWQNMNWTPPFKSILLFRWFYILLNYNLVFRCTEYFVFSFHMPSAGLDDIYSIYSTLGFWGHAFVGAMLAITFILPQKEAPLKKVYSEGQFVAPEKSSDKKKN